jgi:hypothetical protein
LQPCLVLARRRQRSYYARCWRRKSCRDGSGGRWVARALAPSWFASRQIHPYQCDNEGLIMVINVCEGAHGLYFTNRLSSHLVERQRTVVYRPKGQAEIWHQDDVFISIVQSNYRARTQGRRKHPHPASTPLPSLRALRFFAFFISIGIGT